jgi:hypothetical protein
MTPKSAAVSMPAAVRRLSLADLKRAAQQRRLGVAL